MLIGLIRLARPADWIKNVFVLAPVPFAMAAGAEFRVAPFALGLVGFCLINSAVYTLNDLFDARADREHPKKRHRPIAAGVVTTKAAVVQFGLLLLLGTALGATVGRMEGRMEVPALFLAYVGINTAYSLGMKHVALLDVFLLSSGYIIRVLLGCALLDATPSAWLLLCTASLAVFLGFVKRRADLAAGLDDKHRPSLRGYSEAFLGQAITISAGMALVSYALYSIGSEVLVKGREMASIPFVALGIFNYLRLADTDDTGDTGGEGGGGGSPVEVAWNSRSSQLCALGWIVAVTWSLGLW